MEKIDTTQVPIDTDEFKTKVIRLKKRLPTRYVVKLFRKFPDFCSPQNKLRIYNVVNLRTVDEEVYKMLESIAL